MCVDYYLIQHSRMGVDCLAHNGQRVSCANSGDVASPEALRPERDILVVVEAVVEALAEPADDCKYPAATVAPGHRLKCSVAATMSLVFGNVGQQRDRSRQCLEVSVAGVAWAPDSLHDVGFDCTLRPIKLCQADSAGEDRAGSMQWPAWVRMWWDCRSGQDARLAEQVGVSCHPT